MKVDILYGSETGNSELVCYDIEAALKNEFQCQVRDLDIVQPSELNPNVFYVFVVSTHGDGDMPIPAAHFVERLNKTDAHLDGIRFAIFGMGDTLYDATYNWGSEKVATAMKDRAAIQIGDRGLHDASAYDEPDEVAVPWIENIARQLVAETA